MKSLVYAVRSSTRAELLNCTMDTFAHKNDKPYPMRSVNSLSRRTTMYKDNKKGHFEQMLH